MIISSLKFGVIEQEKMLIIELIMLMVILMSNYPDNMCWAALDDHLDPKLECGCYASMDCECYLECGCLVDADCECELDE